MRRRARWRLISLIALGLIALIVVLQLIGIVKVDGTTLVLVVLALVAAVGVAMPDDVVAFVSRLTSLKVGSFEVAFVEKQRAERVIRTLPLQEDDVPVRKRPQTGDEVVDVMRVRAMARRRLRFIRVGLLNLESDFSYIDILSHLHHEELLGTEEVRVILDLLDEAIKDWPADSRDDFLEAAWPLASRLAAHVFDRHTRNELDRAGWTVADFKQSKRHRADFLASRGDEVIVAAARVARAGTSLKTVRKRLSGKMPPQAKRRVIIVPGDAVTKPDSRYPNVETVHLETLL